jgi:predicted phospho-2-dehydro-3-deoxyheptonate aldolase
MELTGRQRRMRRLLGSGRTVILPIDQPVTLGVIPGLTDLPRRLPRLLDGRPDAVVAHRGVLAQISPETARDVSLIMHMSAATKLSGREYAKFLTAGTADAVRAGADAVSVQVTFGVPEETAMLADAARVVGEASQWGLPVLAMTYVRGVEPGLHPEKIAHAARVAAELGCDIVKVSYTGSAESFAQVVDGCFAPVIMAGGERAGDWQEVLRAVADALTAGASGVCIGRNVFQHADPGRALADLRALVHADADWNSLPELIMQPTTED